MNLLPVTLALALTLSIPLSPAVPIAVSGERIGREALALFRQYGVEAVKVVQST